MWVLDAPCCSTPTRSSLPPRLATTRSSILCHALASPGTPLWRAALLADVVCTGASSLSLLLAQARAPALGAQGSVPAALAALPAGWLQHSEAPPSDAHLRQALALRGQRVEAAAACRQCWALAAGLLAACAAAERLQLPWVPEAAYLGTTAVASQATVLRLLQLWRAAPASARRRQLPALLLAAAALALMLLSLPLDRLLCPVAWPWLGTVPLLFAGSALGFAAVVALEGAEARAGAGRGRHAAARHKGD